MGAVTNLLYNKHVGLNK